MPVTDSQRMDFYKSLSGYGYADVEKAIEKFNDVGLYAKDLAYAVREFVESTDAPIDKIDVYYVAYDHILKTARNKLGEILGFDIANNIIDGLGFYTYGNYIDTSDKLQKAIDQLEEKLKNAGQEQIEELLEDNFVKVFLEDINVDINEIRKTEKLEVEKMKHKKIQDKGSHIKRKINNDQQPLLTPEDVVKDMDEVDRRVEETKDKEQSRDMEYEISRKRSNHQAFLDFYQVMSERGAISEILAKAEVSANEAVTGTPDEGINMEYYNIPPSVVNKETEEKIIQSQNGIESIKEFMAYNADWDQYKNELEDSN